MSASRRPRRNHRGRGRSFVAGADIRFFIRSIERNKVDRIEKLTEDLQALLLAIQNCPKPVVARITAGARRRG